MRCAATTVARIHAIVRRSQGHAQSVVQTGDLTVNLDQKTVESDGARVHLTGKEYQMLDLLCLRKGTTLNYVETVWGRGYVLRDPSEDQAKISA